MEHTIAAVATPLGKGGISIIRTSGNDAISIADKVFRGSKKLANVDSHTIHYGFIKDCEETVDEVLM